jgi:hypothetical protein
MDEIRSGAPQARPIPIRLYTTLYLALGRAPPGPTGRPVTPACEEHCCTKLPLDKQTMASKRELAISTVYTFGQAQPCSHHTCEPADLERNYRGWSHSATTFGGFWWI